MPGITQEDINNAITNCEWRIDVDGAYICGGNCGVCQVEIEYGRCDALKELFERGNES